MSAPYEQADNVESDARPAESLAASENNPQPINPNLPYYSLTLVACLILVWICEFIADGPNSFLFGGERSVSLAGFVKVAFAGGQYWRILTGGALHGGVIHLLFNCYALYILGKLIETLSNRAHLAVVFLLSVIGGNLLSFWLSPTRDAVGASGGIVGFLGYLAVYGYRRRRILTPAFLKGMLFNIGFIAFYGIALSNVIDNFGHLGGLLTGAIYGFFQISGNVYEDPRTISRGTDTVGLVALGIFIAVSGFSMLILLRII